MWYITLGLTGQGDCANSVSKLRQLVTNQKKEKKKPTTQNKHFFNTDIKKKKIVRNEE